MSAHVFAASRNASEISSTSAYSFLSALFAYCFTVRHKRETQLGTLKGGYPLALIRPGPTFHASADGQKRKFNTKRKSSQSARSKSNNDRKARK